MAMLATTLLGSGLISTSAFGQAEVAGMWVAQYHEDQPERVPGPELGDYLGLPINDAARMRGETYNSSILTLPEFQCRPHPSDYGDRHSHVRISLQLDHATQEPIAVLTHREWQAQERTLWLDDRPHPPDYAAHTWQGFSTAKWDGYNNLTIFTTHLKESYIRRNGMPRSDRSTVVEHFVRHGQYLTIATIVSDTVYLTEPLIKTSDYLLDPSHVMPPYPCDYVQEVVRAKGAVPSYLPGTNPFTTEFAEHYHLPVIATRGGAETMYPEFRNKIRNAAPASVTSTKASK